MILRSSIGIFQKSPLVLVILFNQFLQKRQDLLFLPPLPAPYRSDTALHHCYPWSSDSITLHSFILLCEAPLCSLNPSRSDGTAEVPKADACCPAALETEESGQVASRSQCPGSWGQNLFLRSFSLLPSSALSQPSNFTQAHRTSGPWVHPGLLP